MASVTRRIEVCDTCRAVDRPIFKRVRMAPEGQRLRLVAFCEEDYKPMADMLRKLDETWPAMDGRRASRKVTLEQIETIKGGTKQASKSTTGTRRARKATQTA